MKGDKNMRLIDLLELLLRVHVSNCTVDVLYEKGEPDKFSGDIKDIISMLCFYNVVPFSIVVDYRRSINYKNVFITCICKSKE